MRISSVICRLLSLLILLLATHAVQAQELRKILPSGASTGAGWSRAWADVDGDGRDDFCYLTGLYEKDLTCQLNRQSATVEQTFFDLWQGRYAPTNGSLRWVDVNGDGFVDVCRAVVLDSPRLICRLGPGFGGAAIEVPWTLASTTLFCPGGQGQCGGSSGSSWSSQFNPGLSSVPSNLSLADFHFADVNGDGLPDLCYLFRSSETVTALRCRIATVNADRTMVSYSSESTAWTRSEIAVGAENWPQGFYDFNGDGFADYCRVLPGAALRCTLSSSAGLLQGEVSSVGNVPHQWAEGAAFVDVNGDGNIDFCRLDGFSGAYYIRCTLSNGIGWEFGGAVGSTRELLSPSFADPGNQYSRWWVDINADGLPDFCRLASSPDPIGDWTTDKTGNLLCRLSRGGGDVVASVTAFGHSDVSINNINLGSADGGRSFCDPFGNGIQVFCRATRFVYQTAEDVCTDYGEGVVCQPGYGETFGFFAGYVNSANTPVTQARQALLSSYSDGVGAETRVTYMPLTSPEVYSRSNSVSNTDSRLLLLQPRSPVVYETRAWTDGANATSLTGNARYLYKDLRTDIWSGSRGFRERWIYHEGANTLDHVVYYQGLGELVEGASTGSVANDLREVGMAKCQEKFAVQAGLVPTVPAVPNQSARQLRLKGIRISLQSAAAGGPCGLPDQEPTASSPFILLQASTNLLGTTMPVDNPRFKIVRETTSKSWDWNGAVRIPLPTTTTTTNTDPWGNVISLVQSTRDGANREWRKTTTNTYTDNTGAWLLGRLTRSEVRTLTPTAAIQLAANASSVGSSSNAGFMSPPVIPPVPPGPLSSAALAAILQLLLED